MFTLQFKKKSTTTTLIIKIIIGTDDKNLWCLTTHKKSIRFLLPTLLYAGYSVKLTLMYAVTALLEMGGSFFFFADQYHTLYRCLMRKCNEKKKNQLIITKSSFRGRCDTPRLCLYLRSRLTILTNTSDHESEQIRRVIVNFCNDGPDGPELEIWYFKLYFSLLFLALWCIPHIVIQHRQRKS